MPEIRSRFKNTGVPLQATVHKPKFKYDLEKLLRIPEKK